MWCDVMWCDGMGWDVMGCDVESCYVICLFNHLFIGCSYGCSVISSMYFIVPAAKKIYRDYEMEAKRTKLYWSNIPHHKCVRSSIRLFINSVIHSIIHSFSQLYGRMTIWLISWLVGQLASQLISRSDHQYVYVSQPTSISFIHSFAAHVLQPLQWFGYDSNH